MIGLVGVLSFLAVSAFVWRVSSSPLDIGFAKDYIQSSLQDKETGNYVLMESVVLYWPDLKGPLYLQMHGGQLMNKSGSTIISVDLAAVSFSRFGLLSGRILPKSIVLKKPTLRLLRNIEGGIEMDLGETSDDNLSDDQFEVTTHIFSYLARPGRESAKRSLISYLEEFHIEGARLFIDDEIIRQSWSLPNFNMGFKSTRLGMKGYADLDLPDVGIDSSHLNIDINYLWDQKNVEVSADLKNIDIKSIAEKIPEIGELANQNVILNAHIETILDEKFVPSDVILEVSSSGGGIFHPDLSDEFVPYEDLFINALYSYKSKSLLLKDTKVTLSGVNVHAGADLTIGDNKVNGPLEVWIDDLKQEQIAPLWPKSLRGDNSEKWIVKRLSGGDFQNVHLGLDVFAEKKLPQFSSNEDETAIQMGPLHPVWSVDVKNLKAKFEFTGMSVDYRAPLDKVYAADGFGSFDLDKDELNVDVKRAKIRDIPVSKATFLLDQVTAKGKGNVYLDIYLNGGIQDLMRYASNDPINLDDDIDMDFDQVKGNADLNIKLDFPAQKDVRIQDFNIGIDGTLTDVLLPDVIRTLDLSGGPLEFSVKDGLASLKGKAMLENRPMDFSWEEFLSSKGKPYKEKVTAKITADPNIRGILGIDLNDFIEGSLPVDVSYISYTDGTSKADIKVDVTPALFFVEPFAFEKPIGTKAKAKLIAHFKNEEIQKITDLTASGDKFKLFKSHIMFKKRGAETSLASGSVSKFILDDTNAKMDFVFDDNGAVNIVLNAEVIDAQPFMDTEEEKGAYEQPTMKISLAAKKMLTAPNEVIKDVKIFMDIDVKGRFNQMEMDARIGQGDFRVRFKPNKEGKRTFRMKTDDAGAFLKAFQVYSDLRGGTMVIYGEPMRGIFDRNLRGKAEISNFKVVNAPALTNLLSILSLGGIGEVLAGDGLNFEKLEADFNWLYRRGGSLLVLKDGRTSGNSLGLLFDGIFDNKKHEVDVSGTIVPMSALNKVIGAIPIIGDILTGGSGGVFAATYSLKGKSDNPEISVNPLSILTPGILRRILWE